MGFLRPEKQGGGTTTTDFFIQIMFYGRLVFMGYLNNEEKTRQALNSEGWLYALETLGE